MPIADTEEFYTERHFHFSDGDILIDFGLFSVGSRFAFGGEMYAMIFVDGLKFRFFGCVDLESC